MNENKKVLKRTSLLAAVLCLAVVSIDVVKTTGQEGTNVSNRVENE
jgi:hypothetical protein